MHRYNAACSDVMGQMLSIHSYNIQMFPGDCKVELKLRIAGIDKRSTDTRKKSVFRQRKRKLGESGNLGDEEG